MKTIFSEYLPETVHLDEVFEVDNGIKGMYKPLVEKFNDFSETDYIYLNDEAKKSFFNQGITFAVYNENESQEKIFPFDLFPRIIHSEEWNKLEKGIEQRSWALNEFIKDIYGDQKILKDKFIPKDLVFSSKNYLKEMQGIVPIGGIYNHISGTDLIKHRDGKFYVLEDNIRCPSGVSYVISNRMAMKKMLYGVFNEFNVEPVVGYPESLLNMMESVKPENVDEPVCALLTPGMYNSAYFEHSYLAQRMGIELVEGRDLFVENDFVYQKTIHGPQKVDVIYRRVDDDFLDPKVFNPKSVLGVPGIFNAFAKGNVSLINAPGTGFADDKAVYSYVPEIVKYYTGEDSILNNVQTYRCSEEKEYQYVMENIKDLVIKPVDEAGGYGVTIGSKLTKKEIEDVKNIVKNNRRKYIAQPIMSLSVHATFIEDSECFEPRHVDLRSFSLLGKDQQFVLKGGLTRVALKKGNLIVNSSQGGGSKDTWVLK